MSLWTRLIGSGDPKLPVHQFIAVLGEWERGKLTRSEAIALLGILPEEEADLDALIAKIIPIPDSISLGAAVVLTNVGTTYDATQPSKGLGFVRIEGAGITGVEFIVRYNKVGTGTLSWQLFDDTTSTELGVFDDSGAASDNKEATITVIPASPLAPGSHTLRVRVKSSVAADDPVYYGASMRIRRANLMFATVLQEILTLAEVGFAPYNDETALKARLGVT